MEYDRLETTWGYVVSLRKDMMGAAPSLEFRKELRKEGIAEDEVYAKKADRIVVLLLANKCTPPDHVAAPKMPKEN